MDQFKAMENHGKILQESDDIEGQRSQFSFLSTAMINTLQAFGYEDTLYIQHCPMAMDNQGADWLSGEEEVKNPYFGDKMMKCGSVKRTLK